jgi:hypothetical protein
MEKQKINSVVSKCCRCRYSLTDAGIMVQINAVKGKYQNDIKSVIPTSIPTRIGAWVRNPIQGPIGPSTSKYRSPSAGGPTFFTSGFSLDRDSKVRKSSTKIRYHVIYGKLFALTASCQQYEVNEKYKEMKVE